MPYLDKRATIALLLSLSAPICRAEEPAPSSAPIASSPSAGAPSPLEVVDRLHHGIDVSSHSGTVEWPKLIGDGHTFAFVKATEGVDLKDPAFAASWQAMKRAGVIRGAYHFYVTEDDPVEQANFFIANVTLEPGDLAPVVDVEVIGHGTSAGLPARLATWLARIEQHYGVKPIIYTTAAFWDQHFDDSFGAHPLWVAEYEVEAPKLPKGWTTWHLWQWKGDATVAGVQKSADLSKVNRTQTEQQLAALVIPPSTPPAATAPR